MVVIEAPFMIVANDVWAGRNHYALETNQNVIITRATISGCC